MAANLNWVDYIILAIFFLSILAGFWRGFIREVVSLITWILAFVVAATFSHPVASAFTSSPAVQGALTQASSSADQPVSYAAIAISFALLFAGTIIVGSILGYVLNMAFQAGVLGIGNRILGGVFGFCRGFIINLVLIFLVQLTPFSQQEIWTQSSLVATYQPTVQWLDSVVSPGLADLKARFGGTVEEVGTKFQGISNSFKPDTEE
ncbi:CvpA family protein [Aquicella lusitana]|uniref:Membrane protein required for colicin V production n=1 Tax=Aquicella lusitana TaxID=254246 RepID=A0A370GYU4_9COXI|nr:CvpA family protein [Aquicella lusitana]RDI48828.1 membrane protein required for colicin V production [Aquicella lusitana]VVC73256.1 Colicin V production protein [Aquicella lusitana]